MAFTLAALLGDGVLTHSPSLRLLVAWKKHFGASGRVAQARAVASDTESSVVVAGQFVGAADFGGGIVPSSGGAANRCFVAKYSRDGRHLWSHTSQGMGDCETKAVATDAARNVYLTGYFWNTVRFAEPELRSQGEGDIFVAKFGPDGSSSWAKRFGSTGSEHPTSILVDDAESVTLLGNFTGTLTMGHETLVSAGETDVMIAKLDASGDPVWAKRFGGTSFDSVTAAARGQKGAIAIAGEFEGVSELGGAALRAVSDRDVFVALYTPEGAHVWSKRFGSAGLNRANELSVDADGNLVVVGSFMDVIDFGAGSMESADRSAAFIAKLSNAGNTLWSKHFGGISKQQMRAYPFMWPADSTLNSAVTMPNGDVIGVGMFAGIGDVEGAAVTAPVPFGDLMLIAYSAHGELRGLAHVSGGDPWPAALASDRTGALLVAGAFDGVPSRPFDEGGGFLVRFTLEGASARDGSDN